MSFWNAASNFVPGRTAVPAFSREQADGGRFDRGVTQIVMPQNWLFLTSYKVQREHLLRETRWDLLARLGPGAFDTISGEVVNVILLTLTHTRPTDDATLHGLDATGPRTAREKAEVLRSRGGGCDQSEGSIGESRRRISFSEWQVGDF